MLEVSSPTTSSYSLFYNLGNLVNSYSHFKTPTQASYRKPSLTSLESKAFPEPLLLLR